MIVRNVMTSDGFQCVRCGGCCRVKGYVHVTREDCDRIAEYLFMDVRSFIYAYTRVTETRGGLSLVENDDNSCVFLEADNACMINDVKPAQCKSFPLKWSFSGWEEICAAVREEVLNA